jgi:hypothetical protein
MWERCVLGDDDNERKFGIAGPYLCSCQRSDPLDIERGKTTHRGVFERHEDSHRTEMWRNSSAASDILPFSKSESSSASGKILLRFKLDK